MPSVFPINLAKVSFNQKTGSLRSDSLDQLIFENV